MSLPSVLFVAVKLYQSVLPFDLELGVNLIVSVPGVTYLLYCAD